MSESSLENLLPYVSLFNLLLAASLLAFGGRYLTRHEFTAGVPDGRQNVAEAIMSFFVQRARAMGGIKVVRGVASFLATCFLLILVSNLMGTLPIPILNNPPTAFYSVPLGLALCAVGGTLILSGAFNGIAQTLKHLVWPNPLQLVSEVTDVLSLSLRLFGNIGGEHMTLVLVTSAVAVGIPLILHVLGLIPAFVQALVFTLLTSSFIASALEHRAEREQQAAEGEEFERVPASMAQG